MPFTRKAPRRIRRHIVTLSELNRANQQVTGELEKLGLSSEDLDEVDVWLVPVSFACYGWHTGKPGYIAIPSVSLANLGDYLSGYHIRLTDILRHEWAHAVADVHADFVDCPAFVRCFSGTYEQMTGTHPYDPTRHLTRYAATMPCEDFAETFHYYIRHKGKLPVRLAGKSVIVRKWKFIERIASAMAKGRTRFR